MQDNALARGTRLCSGRYVIERTLGGGGYGITYEAINTANHSRVALKECYPSFALRRSPNGRDVVSINPKAENAFAHIKKRFSEEAGLLVRLCAQKEIVNVYDSFLENNTAYYTMELLQGMDMQKYLRTSGTMGWSSMQPILIQILRALYVTHQAGFIHRDISPDNIFMLNDGSVRLIDFGNARRYKMNEQMTAVVKEKFAPPEQYGQTKKQGPWTDIYALCVTVYYAMSGILPARSTERMTAGDNLKPLSEISDAPEEVSRAVQIGMHPQENRRFQNVADLAYAMFPRRQILSDLIQNAQRQWNQQPPVQMSQNMRTMPVNSQAHNQSGNQAGPMKHPPLQRMESASIYCVKGVMQGFHMMLPNGRPQNVGRNESGADIGYPPDAPGVSRNQCTFLFQNGMAYVRDNKSTYGTAVNGQRIVPEKWYPLQPGASISFGREVYIVR